MADTIVEQSVRTAKRAMVTIYVATAIFCAVITAERLLYACWYSRAAEAVRTATALTGEILLADERLTMSATLAAQTSDPVWAARYQANVPVIDTAIEAALALAPEAARERFDTETRAANDRLIELEADVFAQIARGEPARARTVLNGAEYLTEKQVLAAGTTELLTTLRGRAERHLVDLWWRSVVMLATAFLVCVVAGVMLWRRLTGSLGRSAAAYAVLEERLRGQASRDPLTGAVNRRALGDWLEDRLACGTDVVRPLTIAALDLDRFKQLNTLYGHAGGDRLLCEVTRRLQHHTGTGGLVARLGGDEFVLALPDLDRAAAQTVAEAVVADVTRPVPSPGSGNVMTVGVSLGLASYPDDAVKPEELLANADLALGRAKREGRGRLLWFDPSQDGQSRQTSRLRGELRAAIERGEITPFYQSIVDFETGVVTGFELLARWRHPELGTLPPNSFIGLAEEEGLIAPLTWSILRQATVESISWPAPITLALNISPVQLVESSLVDRIMGVLEEVGFQPSRLEIEVTETALIADFELARDVIRSLRDRGIQVAMDDFGTGHSSLRLLAEIEFDRIKLDRYFVRSCTSVPQSMAIVESVTALGRQLGVPITAEGIETEDDLRRFRDLGCRHGQGFLFSKPVPAATARLLLTFPSTADPFRPAVTILAAA